MSTARHSFRVGSVLALGARLAGAVVTWRPLLLLSSLLLLLAVAVGLIERGHDPLTAPDRTLDVLLSYALPLATFAVVGLASGRQRLDDVLWPLARFGVQRRYLLLGWALVVTLASLLLAALTVVVGVFVAYGATPGAQADALTSAWIAALGAAAYAGWFTLGATFWRRGRGRFAPLLIDLVVGTGTGVLAFPWPRAHLQNLLGNEPLLAMTQRSSSVVLLLSALVLPLLAALRCGD